LCVGEEPNSASGEEIADRTSCAQDKGQRAVKGTSYVEDELGSRRDRVRKKKKKHGPVPGESAIGNSGGGRTQSRGL